MKKFQSLSLIAVLALLSACGSQQQNPAAYNYGQGLYGQQAGYYPNYGYNNGYGGWNSGWYSQPMQLNGSVYTRTFQVQQGQPIPGIRWGAVILCNRTFDTMEQFDGGMLPASAMTVTINGQAITNGAVTAPTAGTLTITADLSQYNSQIRCGSGLFASGNVSFKVQYYWAQQL